VLRMLCPEPESFSALGLKLAETKCDLTALSLTQTQFEDQAPAYDVILLRFNTRVTSSILTPNSRIKAVISPTTGLDHIDMELAKKRGVQVFHLRGQKKFLKSISGTAELTIGLMLSVMRKIPQSYYGVKNGAWEPGPFRGNEVAGKTLAVVGCGRLGSKVSRVGVALGMNVIAYDPYILRFPSKVKVKGTLGEVLREADVLSLHVPLTAQTKYMISEEEIRQLKDGAVIVNTARGAIISTKALVNGLETSKIGAAALDVLEDEHSIGRALHPLINYACNHDNLLITPHIGGATYESVENTDKFILNKYFQSLNIN